MFLGLDLGTSGLKGVAIATREDMESALEMLDAEATERARAAVERMLAVGRGAGR